MSLLSFGEKKEQFVCYVETVSTNKKKTKKMKFWWWQVHVISIAAPLLAGLRSDQWPTSCYY